MELLLPETAETGRDHLLQQALAVSARDLSVDERYVLRRLASAAATTPATASFYADILIAVPVAEYALHAGITPKVALRRLDMAVHALMGRSVRLNFDDGWMGFPWLAMNCPGEDFYELRFNGQFIKYLRWIATGEIPVASFGLRSFADAINNPAVVARGMAAPDGLQVVLVSRQKARQKRRKAMTWTTLTKRVAKRLAPMMPRDRIADILWALDHKEPWRSLSRKKYHDFTHRDLERLHDWIIINVDKPGFFVE